MENFFELSYLLACPDTPKMRLDYIKYENKLFIFLLEFGQISTIARIYHQGVDHYITKFYINSLS